MHLFDHELSSAVPRLSGGFDKAISKGIPQDPFTARNPPESTCWL